ncbi:MAG: hypothetical protein HKL86_01235 [Acidimicrobiaceae bacterium]|nr:hypothetical protein [Acidimicrobiaceae bacterium]
MRIPLGALVVVVTGALVVDVVESTVDVLVVLVGFEVVLGVELVMGGKVVEGDVEVEVEVFDAPPFPVEPVAPVTSPPTLRLTGAVWKASTPAIPAAVAEVKITARFMIGDPCPVGG